LKRYDSVAPRIVSRAVCLNWFKERVRYIIRWLDGSLARQSFSRRKERVRYIFKWLDGSVARQSFSRIKERVRYIFKWLDGSVARQS